MVHHHYGWQRYAALGTADGQWDSAHCFGSGNNSHSDKLTILDFGRPVQAGGAGYFGYGSVYHNGQSVNLGHSVWLAQQYAEAYWLASSNCPQLNIAIGTNNAELCSGPSPCDPYTAGRIWADAVAVLNSGWAANGYATSGNHIRAVAAGDWEGHHFDPGVTWACAGPTRAFVDGYTAYNASAARLIHFGNALTSSGCWSIQDQFYVAWAATYSYPLPEIYNSSHPCQWVDGGPSCTPSWAVEASNMPNNMYFLGVMATCDTPEPLPYGPCGSPPGIDNGPGQSWDQLWNRQAAFRGFPQVTMPYATNIRYQ